VSRPDETVDVVVAGSGGGIAGAYTAAREGLSVALVEATDRFGGTFAYSGGGGMWFPCNPVLARAGSDDTIEDALCYYRGVVGDRTPAELQKTYVRGGASLIEYLEHDQHFAFKVLPWPDYYSGAPCARNDGMRHIVSKAVPDNRLGRFRGMVRGPLDHERLGAQQPDLLTGGRALIGRFLSAMAEKPNVTAHLDTSLVELLVEEGRVVGAEVETGGRRRSIRARRGVLLATGGFEQNDSMRAEYGVPGAAFDTMGAPRNLGLAHRAAIAAGASTDLMDQAWWSPGLVHPDGRAVFALCFTGGIFVDRSGRRFVNEIPRCPLPWRG
jgi:3-oxosteroid 1-dehydrogenase